MSDGQAPPLRRLHAMRDALRHRGPDDHGVDVFDNVGMVHTRLAIQDLSDHARQPMGRADGRWTIAFNGEIYNHLNLRPIESEGMRSHGDTATLLALLERDGISALSSLNGQFAIAALDRLDGRLYLARDRMGIKPLFYAVTGDGVWFASEIGALTAAGVPAHVRADALDSVLSGSCYAGPNTLLSGIERVPPGSYVTVDLTRGSVSAHTWFTPAMLIDADFQAGLAARSRGQLVDELDTATRNAVHDSMLSDVPVGSFLSGGIDSSLIAAMAVEKQPNLVAFATRWRQSRVADEGPAALRAANALGVELDVLDVTESNWRQGFVASTVHFGVPLANASSVPVAQMAERARRRGIKVLLTGEGADELFGGYDSLHADTLRAALTPAGRLIRAVERESAGGPRRRLQHVAEAMGRSRRGTTIRGPIWDTLTAAAPPTAPAYEHHGGPRRDLETALLVQLDYTLCHLLTRMDGNVMQASVEARVPFLDNDFVALVLNLPLEARIGPWSKGILRDVARRVLPWRVAHRPKVYGMDFDAGSWIERAANPTFLFDGMFRDALGIGSGALRDVTGHATGALRVRLWSAEVWCRSVVGGESIDGIERELWR